MANQNDIEDRLKDHQVKQDQTTHEIIEQERDRLDERQVRIMGYFWNRELQRQRRSLPALAILFFERDRHPPGGEAAINQQSEQALVSLMAKEYIRVSSQRELELDTHGVRWMLHQHPPVVRWWQKLIERVPPVGQLVIGGVGLLASIYGVIQFGLWIARLLPR